MVSEILKFAALILKMEYAEKVFTLIKEKHKLQKLSIYRYLLGLTKKNEDFPGTHTIVECLKSLNLLVIPERSKITRKDNDCILTN